MVNFSQLVVSLAAVAPAIAAPLASAESDASTKYIITLRSGISDSEHAEHMAHARAAHKRSLERRDNFRDLLDGTESSWHIHNSRTFRDLLDGSEGVGKEWHIHSHRSYAGVFDRQTIDEIKAHSSVENIEPAGVMKVHGYTKQLLAPWGLGSISHTFNKTVRYVYDDDYAGDGYTAYVVDSGIFLEHQDFEGRAVFGCNAVEGEDDTDLLGHGSHVAGTIGGATFGVAKKATLISAKACDKDGSWYVLDITPKYLKVNPSLTP